MKRIVIAIVLTCALLTGCGVFDSEPIPTLVPTLPPVTAAPSPEPTPTPEPTPAPPPESELPGFVEGRTYTNRYFGLTCMLEPNWTIYTRAQIDELTAKAREGMDETTAAAYDEALGEGGAAYAFIAAANKRELNMTVQKTAPGSAEETLYAAAAELTLALESVGLANAQPEAGTTVLAGTERPSLTVTGELLGADWCVKSVALEAWGSVAVISASAPTAEDADELLALWQPLEK